MSNAPSWIPSDRMVSMPRAWYWSEALNAWIFFAPERGASLSVVHDTNAWVPIIAGDRFWGPWEEPSAPPAANLTADAPWIRVEQMPSMPAGWYWATYPRTWVIYDPVRNAERSIDSGVCDRNGVVGWTELGANWYLGPWHAPGQSPA